MVEGYEEYKATADTWGPGFYCLIALADLRKALAAMPLGLRRAALVHGQYRHTVRDAASALGVSPTEAHRLYVEAIAWIVRFLNGDDQ